MKKKKENSSKLISREFPQMLQNKNAALDKAKHELKVEAALEKVRVVALAMKVPEDMLKICKSISLQLQSLGVKEIRNVQTAIFYKNRGTYMNYQYYAKHNKTFITDTIYTDHKVARDFAAQMLKGKGKFYITHIEGRKKLNKWITYQKSTHVFIDKYLNKASSLNYYWYSLGPVALGISTYHPLTEEEKNLFKRFLKVFELAYRRYLDIEKANAQAREAQVQASLERVRATAMAMHKSEDLADICEMMYKEFLLLGFSEIRNAIINIYNDTDSSFINYDYAEAVGKCISRFTNNILPFVGKIIKTSRSANDAFSETYVTGKALAEFKELRKKAGQKDDPKLNKATSLYFYFYSIGIGSIGISTFGAISKEKIALLKRFRNVFNLSYQRYVDIAKAEAQAKEARIETALERIRAVAMAMRKPEDLSGIGETLFTELKALDFNDLRNTEIIINHENKKSITSYYYSDYGVTGIIDVDYTTNATVKGWMAELQKADDAFAEIIIPEKEMKEWGKYRLSLGYLPDHKLDRVKTVYYYSYSIGLSALSISSFKPVSKEQIKILERFRNVFKLSYQRYTDIALAEAQAREARIELALERVRARAMSMQLSDELAELVATVFKELTQLNFSLTSCIIWIHDHSGDTLWIASAEMNKPAQPFHIHPFYRDFFKSITHAWKAKDLKWIFSLSGEKKKNFEKAFFKEIPDLQGGLKNALVVPEKVVFSASFNNFGALEIVETEALTDEKFDILHRFGKVFDLSYTRFNDLQKAEAQSREAKIELALERVRARTMAMQRSDELSETVYILFQQFRELGENPDQATIGVINEDEKVIEYWVTMYGKQMDKVFKFSIDEPDVTNKIYKAWKEKKKLLVINLSGKELHDFTTYRASKGGAAYNPEEKRRIINVAFFSKGLLNVQSSESRSSESTKLLERFAAVFEQTYTRFLDLQKAEAQAREAQIEASLERVRSRTMAMHNSQDVGNTIVTMFDELVKLDVQTDRCGILIGDESQYMEVWTAKFNASGEATLIIGKLDMMMHPMLAGAIKAWKNKDSIYTYEMVGEDLKDYYKAINNANYYPVQFDTTSLPAKQIHTEFFFPDGAIFAFTPERLSEDAINIFKRVAGVFALTYRRFLDLQKAEAQAREGQIELALERVRARTMAMQKSEELLEASDTMFDELQKLNVETIRVGIGTIDLSKKEVEIWSRFQKSKHMEDQVRGVVPANVSLVFDNLIKAKKEKKPYTVLTLRNDDVKKHYQSLSEYLSYLPQAKYNKQENFYSFFFTQGALNVVSHQLLTDDECKIMLRFAKVFGQMYTRFLDLQKAEAQARESQIQLALERVRARTMAMQKSSELGDVATVLFSELNGLVQNLWTCGFVLCEKDRQEDEWWLCTEGGFIPAFYLPNIGDVTHSNIYQSWLNGENYHTEKLEGDALQEHYDWLMTIPIAKKVFEDMSAAGFERPDWQKLHCAYFSKGYLCIITREPCAEEEIFKRFAQAFDLTYTRFLDLQKAEAQARESQIQLALERVRARTMAMQHSNELSETATLLFKQIQDLGIQAWSAGFNVWQENDTYFLGYNTGPDGKIDDPLPLPLTEDVFFKTIYDAKKRGEDFLVFESEGESLVQTYRYMDTLPVVGDFMRSIVASGFELPKYQVTHCGFFSQGHLMFITLEPHPEAWDIFNRFTKVFEQTYTRFLDLQKAEAQAREAEIELGLERLRARAMAMQHSDELSDLVNTLFKELTKLDFALNWCIINIIDEPSLSNTVWAASPDIDKAPESYHMRFEDYPFHHAMMKGYQERRTKHVYVLEKEEKKIYDEYLFNETEFRKVPAEAQAASRAMEKYVVTFSFSNFGGLQTVGDVPLSDANLEILSRFGKVFDLTYTRFNDLQKAEAQAREAQIEAALERVRSRSMGMQKSEELKEVIKIVYQQLTHLKINLDHSGFVVDYTPGGDWHFWIADQQEIPSQITVPYFESIWGNSFNEAKEKGNDFFATLLDFEEKNKFYEALLNLIPGLPEGAKEFYFSCPGLAGSTVLFDNVSLYIENFAGIPYSDEENNTLMRFGKVFQQTYTRFLDLKKAETQAREAKIEAALERTRTQSMIMQHSKELDDTLRVFHEQVQLLGIHSAFSFLWLPDEQKDKHIFWAIWEEENNGAIVFKNKAINYPLDRNEPATKQCLIDWKGNEPVVSYRVLPDGVKNYFAAWRELIVGVETLTPDHFRNGLYYIEAFMRYGCFGVMMENDLNESEKKILGRFAIEFERTYTRFLDLQKAEAQAREAQIEAALERVRAKAMAMHNSNDLSVTASIIFTELSKLGIKPIRSGIGLISKEEYTAQIYSATSSNDGDQLALMGEISLSGHPVFENQYEFWLRKENYITNLNGEELRSYYKILSAGLNVDLNIKNEGQEEYGHWIMFTEGFLYAWAEKKFNEAELNILERFKNVIELTFRRYLDLKRSEAQAREAQIETGLERVRSRTLAMQRSDELAETSAVLFQQLIALGIEPNRLYITIIKDETGNAEFWITDEDGSKVSSGFHVNLYQNQTFEKMYTGWKNTLPSISIDMKGEELKTYFRQLQQLNVPFKGGENQERRVQTIACFSKGFIGMASPEPQPPETILLLERFAAVFNLTFTRFNDLKIAEAHALQAEQDLIAIKEAKQKAEEALVELQATQKQLIQSEKMASLGELTAGIAHEIQNPLNFVNNFSEVSNELIDEMKDELVKGNNEEAIAIADDVKQNLGKINHHGKRAADIVKGMLQHSRSSTGIKEPTDINALADEYFRLAYHGLRAKDKSFNATMKTDYDETISPINIIPQDIGRVILNLITNAFYVVTEKKKNSPLSPNGEKENYEPTVTVTTKRINPSSGDRGNTIEIRVTDNGTGIPQKILDKIFQPFFTTKPTGKGTGLGLSLSYDIVKAHGGEIKVETKEGEGSEFIIQLPNLEVTG